MKILQTNYNYQTNTNFKSTYPVVHRIITNGIYIPQSDSEVIRKLQSKLVRALNSSWSKMLKSLDKEALQNVYKWISSFSLENIKSQLKLPKTEQEALAIFRGRMGFYDLDYAYAPKNLKKVKKNINKTNSNDAAEQRVRTFYNREKGLLDGRYYLTYMITGKDIKPFEDDLAKEIGKKKHEALSISDDAFSEEVKAAIKLYNTNGLQFVNNPEYRLKSKSSGMTYILQSNFEAIKNKAGKIYYRFINAKFVPEYTK